MAKVNYNDLVDAIVTHLNTEVVTDSTQDTYRINRKYSSSNLGSHPVVVVIRFAGLRPDPENSMTSHSRARTALFNIMLNTNGLDDEIADTLLNTAITDFEYYLGYDCQSGFVYGRQIIQKAGTTTTDKAKDPRTGLYAKMGLEVFILETG